MAFFSGISASRGRYDKMDKPETSEYSVSEDGQLVREETEEANFEENLTFED
ncbi:hypothetical protein HRTV-24_gp4 [Halorubrum virus HRTV-24]|nr:hypothetical protein HRTV-24_gp4 [Halorubrum virus HRTV-24]UBF21764.1 hypothetical protein HSTV-3_gp4 [Halorubrum virus HSTV-3]UBF21893.1 hypothetical protein HJTV-3_gp4 [Haloarcula virus HJTV-3]UBF22023.1 hypothetical protein HRTV-15_gp4 [Halorubrum virus HRTV-15]